MINKNKQMVTYTISDINNILKGELIGHTNKPIEGPSNYKMHPAIILHLLAAINM